VPVLSPVPQDNAERDAQFVTDLLKVSRRSLRGVSLDRPPSRVLAVKLRLIGDALAGERQARLTLILVREVHARHDPGVHFITALSALTRAEETARNRAHLDRLLLAQRVQVQDAAVNAASLLQRADLGFDYLGFYRDLRYFTSKTAAAWATLDADAARRGRGPAPPG